MTSLPVNKKQALFEHGKESIDKIILNKRVDETQPSLLPTLSKFMFPDVFNPDHAVPIYKTDNFAKITFSVSKYPTKTLGQFLKKLRLEKGLEQRELARRLRVNKNSVCEWENDRKRPSKKSVERLARFFKIGAKTLEDFRIDREKLF